MLEIRVHDSQGWSTKDHHAPLSDTMAEQTARSGREGAIFTWVRLVDPTEDEIKELTSLPQIPQQVQQSLTHASPPPFISTTPHGMILSLRTLSYIEKTSDVETGSFVVVAQDGVVVTVARNDNHTLSAIDDYLNDLDNTSSMTSMMLVDAIIRTTISAYDFVDRSLSDDVSNLEKVVFASNRIRQRNDPVEAIYALKREVSEARAAISPLNNPVSDLLHDDAPVSTSFSKPQTRRFSEMINRLVNHIDEHDRLLGDMLSAYLSIVSVQQNSDMRKISAWAAMITVPTLIAGIYGMNFHNMPELSWPFGYPLIIGVMVLACVALYIAFKKSHWL